MLSPSLTCPSFVLLIIFSPTHLFSPGTDRLINGLSLPPHSSQLITFNRGVYYARNQPDLIASFPDHEDADKITAVAAPTTTTAHYHP